MKNKKGTWLIILGLLLVIIALAIVGNNVYKELYANKSSINAIDQLVEFIPTENSIPNYILEPNMDMPVIEVDGWNYIGIINIESLNVTLPVIEEWSDEASYISPCRYYGSAYKDNMIIAAHNFSSHFGKISNLTNEDRIVFTDTQGNSFTYVPVSLEVLKGTDVESMINNECDLTLFTCTIGGQNRVTVRCERVIE